MLVGSTARHRAVRHGGIFKDEHFAALHGPQPRHSNKRKPSCLVFFSDRQGYSLGSSCVSGTWGQQECDQGSQHRLTTLPNVMNELEETQVERQLLLRDPPMGAKPGPEQRPESFDRVDM